MINENREKKEKEGMEKNQKKYLQAKTKHKIFKFKIKDLPGAIVIGLMLRQAEVLRSIKQIDRVARSD